MAGTNILQAQAMRLGAGALAALAVAATLPPVAQAQAINCRPAEDVRMNPIEPAAMTGNRLLITFAKNAGDIIQYQMRVDFTIRHPLGAMRYEQAEIRKGQTTATVDAGNYPTRHGGFAYDPTEVATWITVTGCTLEDVIR